MFLGTVAYIANNIFVCLILYVTVPVNIFFSDVGMGSNMDSWEQSDQDSYCLQSSY